MRRPIRFASGSLVAVAAVLTLLAMSAPRSSTPRAEPSTASAQQTLRLSVLDGDGQTARVGFLLPTRISVQVVDETGAPVSDAQLLARIESGDGLAAPTQLRTDRLGRASLLWRLGMQSGVQQLSVALLGVDAAVTFTATAQR